MKNGNKNEVKKEVRNGPPKAVQFKVANGRTRTARCSLHINEVAGKEKSEKYNKNNRKIT